MPRSRITRGTIKAEVLTNGLIASAANLSVRKPLPAKKVKKQEYQEVAWNFFDIIEVYHYAVQWMANTLSRAKLIVTEDGKPTTNEYAVAAMDDFFGGQHGEFLRQASIHMTVAGEGYLIGQDYDGNDDWQVAAAVNVKVGPEGYKVDGEVIDETNALIIRFWRPHPKSNIQADSPTRPLLGVLGQLDQATQYVSAQLDSRLMGAGLLLLPQEVTFPTPAVGPNGEPAQASLNTFMTELAATMAAAKANPGSAAASVPMMLQMEAEYLDKVKHLTFWSELDEHAPALRAELIHRIALGLDMPPEALEGTGDVNHWGAWQIDDGAIKSHAEPLLAILTAAIADQYLRVVLQSAEGGAMTPEQSEHFDIKADTAELRLRPDRSKEAFEAWDRGQLSGEALRREIGFEETDAMDEKEQAQWLRLKLAQGSPSPELVLKAAQELGVAVDLVLEPEGQVEIGREDRPLPRSLEEHPTRDIPDPDAASLLASAEAAVFRALELAGKRIKSTSADFAELPSNARPTERYRYIQMSKTQMDFCLADAWSLLEHLTLPEAMDVERFEALLDNYTRMLISSRQPYSRDLLASYLTLTKEAA